MKLDCSKIKTSTYQNTLLKSEMASNKLEEEFFSQYMWQGTSIQNI